MIEQARGEIEQARGEIEQARGEIELARGRPPDAPVPAARLVVAR